MTIATGNAGFCISDAARPNVFSHNGRGGLT